MSFDCADYYDGDFEFKCPNQKNDEDPHGVGEFDFEVIVERQFKKPTVTHNCCECGIELSKDKPHYAGKLLVRWDCETCDNGVYNEHKKYAWLHQCDDCRELARKWNKKHFDRCEIPYNGLAFCLSNLDDYVWESDNEEEDERKEPRLPEIADELRVDVSAIYGRINSVDHTKKTKKWYHYLYANSARSKGLPLVDYRGKEILPVEVNGI